MVDDRQARREVKLAVRIFGTDAEGRVFSETVFTSNISQQGAELTGVQVRLKVDEIIGLAYGAGKGRFRVCWVGQPNTLEASHIGLLNLAPEKVLWDVSTPQEIERGNWRAAPDQRAEPRVRCECSVEIHPDNQSAPIRSRTGDLSLGGCFIEMSLPLAKGTGVKVGVWLNETRIWAIARVVTCTPGFGNGVKFLEISSSDKQKLRDFLRGTAQAGI